MTASRIRFRLPPSRLKDLLPRLTAIVRPGDRFTLREDADVVTIQVDGSAPDELRALVTEAGGRDVEQSSPGDKLTAPSRAFAAGLADLGAIAADIQGPPMRKGGLLADDVSGSGHGDHPGTRDGGVVAAEGCPGGRDIDHGTGRGEAMGRQSNTVAVRSEAISKARAAAANAANAAAGQPPDCAPCRAVLAILYEEPKLTESPVVSIGEGYGYFNFGISVIAEVPWRALWTCVSTEPPPPPPPPTSHTVEIAGRPVTIFCAPHRDSGQVKRKERVSESDYSTEDEFLRAANARYTALMQEAWTEAEMKSRAALDALPDCSPPCKRTGPDTKSVGPLTDATRQGAAFNVPYMQIDVTVDWSVCRPCG